MSERFETIYAAAAEAVKDDADDGEQPLPEPLRRAAMRNPRGAARLAEINAMYSGD